MKRFFCFICLFAISDRLYCQKGIQSSIILEINLSYFDNEKGKFIKEDSGKEARVHLYVIDSARLKELGSSKCNGRVFDYLAKEDSVFFQLFVPAYKRNIVFSLKRKQLGQFSFFKVNVNISPNNPYYSYNINYVIGDLIRLKKENDFTGSMDIIYVESLPLISFNGKTGTGARKIDKCYFHL